MTFNPVSDASLAGRPIDLTNCDREPIHIPGSIQPHGCLLACDDAGRVVQRHSANAAGLLGLAGDPNGMPLREILGAEQCHRISNALAMVGPGPRPALVFGIEVNGGCFDVSAHHFDEHVILEFEPQAQAQDAARPADVMGTARTVLGRLRLIDDPERLIRQAAALVQAQLGYDRVMIYELGPDGAGKVVGEARDERLESFRGQYFPASDIPQQARALYLRNPIRVIGDVNFIPVPVVPLQGPLGEPLDLSYAHLRSVSAVHCEYLRNMGVAASMSISIIIEGALWGLITCHHYQPKVLGMAERAAAEMLGEFFSMHLDALRRRKVRETEAKAHRAMDDLMVNASRSEDIGAALRARLSQLAGLVPADGAGLWFDGEWSTEGMAPSREAAEPILRLAAAAPEGEVFASDRIADMLADPAEAPPGLAGVLMIPLSQRSRDFLIYFRRETVHTLDWAGDPNKTYESGPLGDRLTPRKSFAIWKETVRGRSLPWSDADRRLAEALRISVVEVLLFNSEMLADERNRAAIRQRVLNQELNHRVKNILAVIQSLVAQHPARGDGVEAYAAALRGRVQALAYAHDQVVRDGNGGRLADLLAAELGPYRTQEAEIRIDGPAVLLDARAFSVMALVVHEMATNAAKYGALSRPEGRLTVAWSLDDAGACHILWQESGLTGVKAPSARGFGSSLVERALPFDLGGESRLNFHPEGVTAEFLLPARVVSVVAPPDEPAERVPDAVVSPLPAPGHGGGARVLLVEDQVLIAMSLEAELKDFGYEVPGIAADVATALRLIEAESPDLAVLDVNLGREDSLPVARVLQARGVHFVFATGYGADFELPEEFAGVPVVDKPYQLDDVLRKLRRDT